MALLLSIIATIIAIGSFALSFKNFQRSKRLDTVQRLDHLLLKLSDLNAKNSEAHMIAARYNIVKVYKASIPVTNEEYKKELKTQIASIERIEKNLETITAMWDEAFENLHSIYLELTLKPDPARIERLITLVQRTSDNFKTWNDVSLASLHTLETVNPMLKESIAEVERLELQKLELDSLKKAIREIDD